MLVYVLVQYLEQYISIIALSIIISISSFFSVHRRTIPLLSVCVHVYARWMSYKQLTGLNKPSLNSIFANTLVLACSQIKNVYYSKCVPHTYLFINTIYHILNALTPNVSKLYAIILLTLILTQNITACFFLYFRTSTIIYRSTLKKVLIFLKDMGTSSATDASLKWNTLANSGM